MQLVVASQSACRERRVPLQIAAAYIIACGVFQHVRPNLVEAPPSLNADAHATSAFGLVLVSTTRSACQRHTSTIRRLLEEIRLLHTRRAMCCTRNAT